MSAREGAAPQLRVLVDLEEEDGEGASRDFHHASQEGELVGREEVG
jgi:hypothetical protein